MNNRNYTNTQTELALPLSINDAPFFHTRRHPRPQRPCRRSRARWWFQHIRQVLDSIPDTVAQNNP